MMIDIVDLEKTSALIIEQLIEKGLLNFSANSDSNSRAIQVVLKVLTSGLSKYVDGNSVLRNSRDPLNISSDPNSASELRYETKSGSELLFQLLYDWCPVFFFDNGNCCIAGHIIIGENYRLYRTNLIHKLFERGRKFRDEDGKHFELRGPMCAKTYDKIAEIEGILRVECFPVIFLKSFREGIPINWRDVIKDTISKLLDVHQRSASSIIGQDKDSSNSDVNCVPDPDPDSVENSTKESFKFDIVSGSPFHSKTLSAGIDKVYVNRVKNGGDIELSECLTRTRSGRLVKPILDTWRGQKITETSDGRLEVSLGTLNDKVGLRMYGVSIVEDSGYVSTPRQTKRKTPRSYSARKRLSFSSESDDDTALISRLMRTASRRRMTDDVGQNRSEKDTARNENDPPPASPLTTTTMSKNRRKISVTTPLSARRPTKFDEVKDYDDGIIVIPDSPVACSSSNKRKRRTLTEPDENAILQRYLSKSVDLDSD